MEKMIESVLEEIDSIVTQMKQTEDKTSDEYKRLEQAATNLIGKVNESARIVNDYALEAEKLELEDKKVTIDFSKMDERKKAERIEFWARLGFDTVAVAAPLAVYTHQVNRGFKFEETGAITSNTMRGLLGKINPFKKV
jgi:DNA anti-recombination protein RmuC